MGIVALRAEFSATNPAEEAVKRFFSDFAARRLTAARRRTTRDFSWFGKRIDDAAWKGEKLSRFLASKLQVSNVRPVSMESVEAMPKHAVVAAFGPLTRDHRVVFADVTRQGETSTVIVVVSLRDSAAIERVMDPSAFVEFVEAAAVLSRISPA